MKTSLCNHIKGTVKEIVRGNAMCEVDIDTPAGALSAVITTRSLEEMDLRVGDQVTAAMKATSVFFEKS
jgi:molybdopterin-binding protein